MIVGRSAKLRVRIWRTRGVCRPGKRSATWHQDRDRAGVDGPAAQRQPVWLTPQQMRYFSLFNSA